MISIIVAIALVGLIVWAIVNFIPMPDNFKRLIYVVAIVFMVLYVLKALGLFHGLPAGLR